MVAEYLEQEAKNDTAMAAHFASVVLAHLRDNQGWCARPHAESSRTLLAQSIAISQEDTAQHYELLGMFYLYVRDVKNAYECSQAAAAVVLEQGDLQASADHLKRGLKYIATMPQEMRPDVNEEDIRETYGDLDQSILDALNARLLTVDPVEHTPAFHAVYDEVMEATEARLEKEGNTGVPYQRWAIMEEEFEKRGIAWRSPARMNPRVRFD